MHSPRHRKPFPPRARPAGLFLLAWLPAILCVAPAWSQVVTPATPKFEGKPREIGGSMGFSGMPEVKPEQKSRKVTYIAVSDEREWHNEEGKALRASLLAWEDPSESMRYDLTLVKNGQVRLLFKGNRVATYPLARLSKEDQKFIAGLIEARKQAEAKRKAGIH